MGLNRFVRSSGGWLIVGSLLGVGIGIKEAFAPTPFGTFENVVMQGIVIVANTLTLVGVVGLARAGAAGEGWLARVGLGIALAASALFLPFTEGLSQFFVDSSALVKRYVTEVGTSWIQALADPVAGNMLVCAAITRVEVAAALASRHRASGGLSLAERDGCSGTPGAALCHRVCAHSD